MLVECIGNRPDHLKNESAKQAYAQSIHQDQVDLTIGARYRAYGICYRDGNSTPWFLICEDDDDEYPTPHLGAFFKVVDNTIPEGWSFSCGGGNTGDTAILPTPWANNPWFLEELVDGNEESLAYFQSLKKGQ